MDALGFISLTGTNMVLRSRALQSCDWFPTESVTEDWELGMRMVRQGGRVGVQELGWKRPAAHCAGALRPSRAAPPLRAAAAEACQQVLTRATCPRRRSSVGSAATCRSTAPSARRPRRCGRRSSSARAGARATSRPFGVSSAPSWTPSSASSTASPTPPPVSPTSRLVRAGSRRLGVWVGSLTQVLRGCCCCCRPASPCRALQPVSARFAHLGSFSQASRSRS